MGILRARGLSRNETENGVQLMSILKDGVRAVHVGDYKTNLN